MSDNEETGRGRPNKVARLIEQYGLEAVGDEVEAAWTGERGERKSLRTLANYFNKELLQKEIEDTELQILDSEVANLYQLLTEDGVSRAEKTRARRKLTREGIDVDSLLEDFVSYQSIRNYLQSYRDAEYTHVNTGNADVVKKNIQRLRGRTATVTEDKVDQLKRSNELDIDSFRTIVDISVVCEDCGTQYEIRELLEQGYCDCRRKE